MCSQQILSICTDLIKIGVFKINTQKKKLWQRKRIQQGSLQNSKNVTLLFTYNFISIQSIVFKNYSCWVAFLGTSWSIAFDILQKLHALQTIYFYISKFWAKGWFWKCYSYKEEQFTQARNTSLITLVYGLVHYTIVWTTIWYFILYCTTLTLLILASII